MPIPIMPVNQRSLEPPDDSRQDISGLIPLILNPMTVLQDMINNDNDKGKIKEIWLKSESMDDGCYKVSSSIADSDLWELKGRGLINGDGRVVSFTERGEKILREAILDDEDCALSKKASLVKKASKKLVCKNSYDFGDEVLVRTNKEKFGSRYITIAKKAFSGGNGDPQQITKYKIQTRKANSDPKSLNEYTEAELIQTLHLTKKIIANRKAIVDGLAASGKLPAVASVDSLRSFAATIISELNSR